LALARANNGKELQMFRSRIEVPDIFGATRDYEQRLI
jgi:hypothetical protein